MNMAFSPLVTPIASFDLIRFDSHRSEAPRPMGQCLVPLASICVELPCLSAINCCNCRLLFLSLVFLVSYGLPFLHKNSITQR
jgi:hypothetical protein